MKKRTFFAVVLSIFSAFGADNRCVTCIKTINTISGAATCCLIATANKTSAPFQPCCYGGACVCGTIFCLSAIPVLHFKKSKSKVIVNEQPRKQL